MRQKRRTQTCTIVLSSAGLLLETMSLTLRTGMTFHLQVHKKWTVLYNRLLLKTVQIITLFLLLQLKSWCVGWWRLTRCYELQRKMLCFMSGKLHIETFWVIYSHALLQSSVLHHIIMWHWQDCWKWSLGKKPEGWSVCTVWEELCKSQVEGKIINQPLLHLVNLMLYTVLVNEV